MKKQFLVFFIAVLMFLGGCTFLEDVNNTVTYVEKATDYVSEVTTFVQEVPTLIEQAISDPQALEELEARLLTMKEEMETFNQLDAPEIVADLHQQILEHNTKALEGIDLYLNNIKDGQLDPSVLENTEIFQSLKEIANIIEQIKQIGQ